MGEDCDDLLRELSDLLHGDLDAERKKQLTAHLEACPPCFETADFQAQFRQIVAKRCSESVPDDFRAKIAAMLNVECSTRRPDSAEPGGRT